MSKENAFPQIAPEEEVGPVVRITTSYGDITIKLFEKEAPMTVENFLQLAKGGTSIWGHSFEDEFSDVLFNIRGALSMANSGPNTNGSQILYCSK